jgi:hypothetical protein
MMITLKTLGKATLQQVFDQVANHLMDQGERAATVNSSGRVTCYYRLNDLKCAAGCLIGDDEYESRID